MKKILVVIALLFSSLSAFAQSNNDTLSFFIARTGIRTDSPHVGTYHYGEFFQIRGNWIYPDVGYIDFASGTYREFFIGAGRTLYNGKHATFVEELYFDQATGPAAHGARYLMPWTLFDYRFTPKVTAEAVYFPYLPLNKSARIQHVIERAKVEYGVAKWLKVGGGYGAYQYGNDSWQNKPLVTTTFLTKAGSFEIWLQKMPGGAQVQLRYQLITHHKR